MTEKISDLFGLGKMEDGDWFPYFESRFDMASGEITYDEPKKGAVEFCIRSMQPFFEEKNSGRKKENKMVLNPVSRAMERVSFYPDRPPEEEKQLGEDAWDYAIIAARKGDESLDVSREDKLELVNRPMFLRYVKRVFDMLNGEVEKKKEAAEKN